MIKIFFAKAVAVSAPAQTSVPSPKKNFRFDPFTPTPLYRRGYLSSLILGLAELDACVARFMKVIIRNLATRPDAENRPKNQKKVLYLNFQPVIIF